MWAFLGLEEASPGLALTGPIWRHLIDLGLGEKSQRVRACLAEGSWVCVESLESWESLVSPAPWQAVGWRRAH